MTNGSKIGKSDGTNNIDAYLDAFISDNTAWENTPEVADRDRSTDMEAPEIPSPRSKAVLPQLDEDTGIRSFPIYFQDSQQLQNSLHQPRIPVATSKNKGRFKPLRGAVLVLGVMLVAVTGYKYFNSCKDDSCQWPSKHEQAPELEKTSSTPSIQAPKEMPLNPFREAVKQAIHASEKAKIADNEADWKAVRDQWLSAINLMKSVPESSPKYELAQQKVGEYIHYLASATEEVEFAAQHTVSADLAESENNPSDQYSSESLEILEASESSKTSEDPNTSGVSTVSPSGSGSQLSSDSDAKTSGQPPMQSSDYSSSPEASKLQSSQLESAEGSQIQPSDSTPSYTQE